MGLRKTVGLNARRLRQTAKLSQDEVAAEIGVDQGYLSRIEAGQKNLTLDTLELLARALGAEPAQFFEPVRAPTKRLR